MENRSICVESILQLFHEKLTELYDKSEISQFIYILFEEWKGWSRAQLHLNLHKPVTTEDAERFQKALADLVDNRPIQYIIGHVLFFDLDLLVKPDVLIPRPETEELVQMIITDNAHRRFESFSVMDIGAGSGCIGLSIKKHLPFCNVLLIDISSNCLDLARENADRNDCKVDLMEFDIIDQSRWDDFQNYQLIVSNPPYVLISEKQQMHKNILTYEPHEALFVPDENPLLFYNAIAEFSYLHLSRPGLLYFEINEKLGDEIKKMLIQKGFERTEIIKDLNGKDRFIRAEIKIPVLDTSYWNVEH